MTTLDFWIKYWRLINQYSCRRPDPEHYTSRHAVETVRYSLTECAELGLTRCVAVTPEEHAELHDLIDLIHTDGGLRMPISDMLNPKIRRMRCADAVIDDLTELERTVSGAPGRCQNRSA